MKIAIVTNIRSPYRILQIEEMAKNTNNIFSVYYTDTNNVRGRNWDSKKDVVFKESVLEGKEVFKQYGYINTGLKKIVKENDVICIGGYNQPTYIALSILCKIYKKPSVMIFDGITIGQEEEKNLFKQMIKKLVIKNASAYFANGISGEKFFHEFYNEPKKKIFNQYLTVDIDEIFSLKENYSETRNSLRNQYNITSDEKVLIYSGRVIAIKNLFKVVDALHLIGEQITFFIVGGGELEEELKAYAKKKGVRIIVTGFLSDQKNVFSHYLMADAFILPSIEEPWGLVVNEAMAAGLNVIVSDRAGCSLDLVKGNGELIDPYNIESIKSAIENVMISKKYDGKASEELIKSWSFKNSAKSFENLLIAIK